MDAYRVSRRVGICACVLFALLVAPAKLHAAGQVMFPAPGKCTAEKPQSKLFRHDGAWWCVLQGNSGVAFYRLVAGTWRIGTFPGAILQSSGKADVKWNGTHLFVLVYSSTPRLYKYSYNSVAKSWVLLAGFPVNVPRPSSAETMVLEQDSSGRLWITAEGGGSIHVHYTTTSDHRTWTSSPILLANGVDSDDISSVIAFAGQIGVFWSDQNRDRFGFRVHRDVDPPGIWGPLEVVYSGSRVAEDHVSLAADASGRVFAATKNHSDQIQVHRRNPSGVWGTRADIARGSATRPIIMVSDDARVYVLYTRWGLARDHIEYKSANVDMLLFGFETVFINSSSNVNNVTGTKQRLPAGTLIAAAENGAQAMWNGFGQLGETMPEPPVITAAKDTPVGTQTTEWSAAIESVSAVQVRPNPLRGQGVLEYSLIGESSVRIDVFDVAGRRVRTLLDSPLVASGHHVLQLGRSSDQESALPAGVYLYRVQAAEIVRMGRFVVLD